MTEEKEQEGRTSRWQRLGKVGRTLIVGTLVPALGWVVLNIDKVEKVMDLFGKKEKQSEAKTSVTPTPPPPCHALEVKTFDVFPYYLVNTYSKNPEHPYIYWTSIAGQNECPHDLNFTVRFYTDKASDDGHKTILVGKNQFNHSVSHGKSINKRINPELEFLSELDEDVPFFVEWKIFDQLGDKLLKQGSKHIIVKTKNAVYWDLKDPDGRNVDMHFLLASLSAWAQRPAAGSLRDRAYTYLQGIAEPGEWIEKCYQDLFHTASAVKVRPFPGRWPPATNEDIQMPAKILKARKADSVEAALLIAALKRAVDEEDLDLRLVLFALEQEDNNGAKHFLLAWPTEGKAWRAIDVTDPNQRNFADNVAQATRTLATLLLSQGKELLPKLDEQGVFISPDHSVLALDFQKASEEYYIGPLRLKR